MHSSNVCYCIGIKKAPRVRGFVNFSTKKMTKGFDLSDLR